LTRKSR